MVRREPLWSLVATIARLAGPEVSLVATIARLAGPEVSLVATIAVPASGELHPARAHRRRPPHPHRVPAVLCPAAIPPPRVHPRAGDDRIGLRAWSGVGLPQTGGASASPRPTV